MGPASGFGYFNSSPPIQISNRARERVDDRGSILFEYKPLPMSPMTVAIFVLLGIVTLAAPFTLPPELFPLGGVCFLPLAGVLAWAILQQPSPTRIRANGVEVSLPLWRRALRRSLYVPWVDVRNVYPAAYEISGAAMSPFASSAGTLIHTGLGVETTDGRRRTVKFTPGSIRSFRGESPGFTYAMNAVRQALDALGRPLVTQSKQYSDEEVRAMHEEARHPLVGMGAIVLAFFLPPTLVAVAFVVLDAMGTTPAPIGLATILILAAIPPFASMRFTLTKSRRRNYLLGELAKHEETLRARRA